VSTGGPGGGRGDLRYTRDVGPGDAGVRVTLRRRLDDGALGDLLGQLLSWQDGEVRLLDRHGTEHVVAEADVVAAKRIPPPPARRG
jgi:hypothetical protein